MEDILISCGGSGEVAKANISKRGRQNDRKRLQSIPIGAIPMRTDRFMATLSLETRDMSAKFLVVLGETMHRSVQPWVYSFTSKVGYQWPPKKRDKRIRWDADG